MKKIIRSPETHPLTWRFRSDKKPVWLKEYASKDGYVSAKKTIKNMYPNDIISLIQESGLRGRGGAGFPTGLKWSMFQTNENLTMRYLLCNADEMEPGTYKDRFLMENMPHQLIEGMIISAYAIQANKGYIFIRGEYIEAIFNLKRAILEAKEAKFLGQNIFNTAFNFELFLHTGAGRYICGEETALINSLEGYRANPRSKPPFPSSVGVWGKPTCVNNVETLSNIPAIILNGTNWYKNISKNFDAGTKMIGFSGNVQFPGVWELPFGITGREILEEYAGGMLKHFKFKAWQPGGAGTDILTETHLDIPLGYTSFEKIGTRLGTAIAMAIDDKVSIVSLMLNIEDFFSRESCGFCTPCRDGLPWSVKILSDLEKKKGHVGDIEMLEELCHHLSPGKTFCAHAPGAAAPLKSAIKHFRKEFEAGIFQND